jgi:DNA-binding NarL/FixJ family response regulator
MVRVGTRQQIALIDDHALYREGMRAVLRSEPMLDVTGDAGTGREAIELLSRATFDLAVVDVMLPDQPGPSLVRDLRRLQPRCKVLALSMVEAPYAIAEMLRAGAAGYALKSQATEEILAAIHAVACGHSYLAPCLPRDRILALTGGVARGPLEQLTAREREVFDLLIRGWTNERVATTLHIAVRTAETHRQNIMSKLGVHSIAELIRLAARHGMLDETHA